MGKVLLFSILLVTVVLPALAARGASPVRGFRRLVFGIAAFNVLYLLAIVYLLPRLG